MKPKTVPDSILYDVTEDLISTCHFVLQDVYHQFKLAYASAVHYDTQLMVLLTIVCYVDFGRNNPLKIEIPISYELTQTKGFDFTGIVSDLIKEAIDAHFKAFSN